MFPCVDFDVVCQVLAEGADPCRVLAKRADPYYVLEDWEYEKPSIVSFSRNIEMEEIPNLRDLPKKEKDALWYTEPVKQSKHSLLRCLLCDSKPDRRDEGTLDLDDKKMRILPVSAVLTEQENQREEGSNDPDTIAKMYRQCSAHSAMMARMRAFLNETESRDYLIEKRRRHLISSLFRRTS